MPFDSGSGTIDEPTYAGHLLPIYVVVHFPSDEGTCHVHCSYQSLQFSLHFTPNRLDRIRH